MNISHPSVSLIVLGFYVDDKFVQCMNSLTALNYPNYEIILVWSEKKENFNTRQFLIEHQIPLEKIRIFEYKKNLGFALGNNIGVKFAKNELVLIINPDVEVKSDFLHHLILNYQNLITQYSTDKIIIGPRICNPTGIIEYSSRVINFLGFSNMNYEVTEKIKKTMITSGCAFLIKKQYYLDLTGFDVEYFMYHEDIDFSIRAAMNGFLQFVDNSTKLWHLKTDEEYKLSKFKYFYHERNRLAMTLEHSKKPYKMLICQLLLEPLQFVFAIMKGFLPIRIRVWSYIILNFKRIINSNKKNEYSFQYYEMDGIFNELNKSQFVINIMNFYARLLYFLYKS